MSEPDGLLELLVDMANRGFSDHSISLAVNGTIISGMLASGQEYAQETAARIREAAGTDHRGIDVFFDKMAEEWAATRDNDETETEVAFDPPRYIHIKDGCVVAGEDLAFGEGCWWRIRIAEVSGWTFTRVVPAPAPVDLG